MFTGFLTALAAFLIADVIWLSLVGIKLFQASIAEIMRPQPLIAAAVLFYVIYTIGIYFFAVRPALRERSLTTAATSGAMLGLVAYATFDLTNLAVLKSWSPMVAAIDMAWGTAATAFAAVAGYAAGRWRMTPSPQ
jgi:uncharacterized membrane protein